MEKLALKSALESIREFVKDTIRGRSVIPFHEQSLWQSFPKWVEEQMGIPRAEAERFRAAATDALTAVEAECPGLRIRLRDDLWGIDLSITGTAEWANVVSYAHGASAEEAVRHLSPPATELLERIESGELVDEFRSELSVRHRIRYFGYSRFPELIDEIRTKRGVEIAMEEQGDKWQQRKHRMKFRILSRHDPSAPPGGYNPVVAISGGRGISRREFRRWYTQLLVDSPYSGPHPEILWSIRSRAEFFRCFPDADPTKPISAHTLVKLLQPLRAHRLFKIGWDFGSKSSTWSVTVGPAKSWEETRAGLQEELARPSPETQFGLSAQAAALFEWIQDLAPDGLEWDLTPTVEKGVESQALLLDCPWARENFRLFIQILCEEISERTPVVVQPVDWREASSCFTRLRVRSSAR